MPRISFQSFSKPALAAAALFATLARVGGFACLTAYQNHNAIETLSAQARDLSKDPETVELRNVTLYRQREFDGKINLAACGDINGKNAFGAYTGYRAFIAVMDPHKLVTFDHAKAIEQADCSETFGESAFLTQVRANCTDYEAGPMTLADHVIRAYNVTRIRLFGNKETASLILRLCLRGNFASSKGIAMRQFLKPALLAQCGTRMLF